MKARLPVIVILLVSSILLCGSLPTNGQVSSAEPAKAAENPAPELYMFDFYSTKSAHCAALRPTVAKAELHFAGRVKVIHINLDAPQNKPFAEQVGVEAVPTLIVVNRAGDQLKRLVGSVEGTVVGILLETLLPDSREREDVPIATAEAPTFPIVLTKQEARLDPGS